MKQTRRGMLPLLSGVLWALAGLLFFTLPVTSAPLVARLSGSSMVAPLALLPLAGLLVWLVARLLRGGKIPPQVIPLLAFLTVAAVSAAAATFLPFPPYKSASVARSALEALATLAVGISFYLVPAVWIETPEQLRFCMRWLNWGGAVMLAWTAAQVIVFRRFGEYPQWMWDAQWQISTSLLLYANRAVGIAYEPSWLAHQLNMLYLPVWLSAVLHNYTAHRLRLGWLHLEQILLAGGVAALVLSVSRIGLLSFLLMLGLLLVLASIRIVRWLPARLLRGTRVGEERARSLRGWLGAATVFGLLLVYVGMLVGGAYGLSRYDARMRRLFDFSVLREQSFVHYANQLVFAERIVFWEAGWGVFNDYPLLGVGPGNAGFFFSEKLSAFSWALTEVRTLMYQWTALPNIKSLWLRLLAETGVVGFACFLCWLFVLWYSARAAFAARGMESKPVQVAGLAGMLALAAFLVEGFSLDTFALPYYWIMFGVVTAACQWARDGIWMRREDAGSRQ